MLAAFVPLSLDALALRSAAKVAGPLADFSGLPWSNGRRDFNADRPWLGQSLQRPAFAAPDLVLETGVHLHWALPDGLTRAASGRTFPIVPNRWLVERRSRSGTAAWVVESDALTPPTAGRANAVTYPAPTGAGAAPYARLGRTLRLDDWLTAEPPARRVGLTAVGYGEASFAAYYPSCRGVFGLHDAGAPLDEALEYRLIGWYAHPGEDPLDASNLPAVGASVEALSARLGWDFEGLWGGPPTGRPERTVCYAVLKLTADAATNGLPPPPEATLADSGLEAISVATARLHADDPERHAHAEAEVDAGHLFEDLKHLEVDRLPQLQAKRHERGFIAEPGGELWRLRARQRDGTAADAAGAGPSPRASLPPTLADRLNRLNLRQAAYDHAARSLDDLRRRIFADWSKYILSAYPPFDQVDGAFDLDIVRDFIERGDLHELERRERQRGSLDLSFEDDGARTGGKAGGGVLAEARGDNDGEDESLGGRLAAECRRVLAKTAVLNATRLSGRRVGRPTLERAPDGGSSLAFDGSGQALILDWIDGWGAWPVVGLGRTLPEFSVILRVRPDRAAAAPILSFGERLSVELVEDEGGVFFAFVTRGAGEKRDALLSPVPAAIGSWVELAATWSLSDGVKRLYLNGKLAAEAPLGEARPPGLGERRYGVLGATSRGEAFEAAAGGETPVGPLFAGAVAKLRVDPAKALGAAEIAALDSSLPPPLALSREPAPRFWRPRDPVVMLKGEAARASGRFDRGLLTCHVLRLSVPDEAGGKDTGRLLDFFAQAGEVVAAIPELTAEAGRKPAGKGFHASDGAPWHPLMIEWETALHPVSAGGPHAEGRDSYAADFVTASFEIDPEGLELIPRGKTLPAPDRRSITSGRSVLTPFAARAHREHEAKLAEASGEASVALTDDDFSDAQSQALGGFHQALLQHHQGLALPPDDPLAFGHRREFSRTTIREAVGAQTISACAPDQPFLPIRAGRLEVRRLRLIDAFGRTLDVPLQRLALPTRLTGGRYPSAADLPPRLAQPARLNFRWLSARGAIEEMNEHPATAPVCGWLVANYLDAGLAVHARDGRALGEVSPAHAHPWRPVPGDLAAPEPERFENPTLVRVTRHLAGLDAEQRGGLIDAIRRSLESIRPPIEESDDARGLIAGRPLALVRAKIGFEVKGLPAVDHDWRAFKRDLGRRGRHHAGFTGVEWPVRLGEPARADDGLVLFWVEGADGLPAGPARAPRFERTTAGGHVLGSRDPDFPLRLSLGGGSLTLTMLIDPAAPVHATSGVQPVKAIRVPSDQFAASMGRIGVHALVAPLLAPGGRVAPPLPRLAGFEWAWRQRVGGGWRETPGAALGQPRADAAFGGKVEAAEGWLVLTPKLERE